MNEGDYFVLKTPKKSAMLSNVFKTLEMSKEPWVARVIFDLNLYDLI